MELLIELQFLPPIEYFCVLQNYSRISVERHEHFVKQSYRNRCYINTAQGPEMLIVPLTNKHGKVPLHEVKIDYSKKWQNNHWRTIESAYRNAPFYEHYCTDLHRIIYTPFVHLFDLNLKLLSFCLANLLWHKEIVSTTDYQPAAPLAVNDLRSVISPKKPFSERSFYTPEPYYQVFGSTFAANLSVLDLLFCAGPQAPAIIRASGRAHEQLSSKKR